MESCCCLGEFSLLWLKPTPPLKRIEESVLIIYTGLGWCSTITARSPLKMWSLSSSIM